MDEGKEDINCAKRQLPRASSKHHGFFLMTNSGQYHIITTVYGKIGEDTEVLYQRTLSICRRLGCYLGLPG